MLTIIFQGLCLVILLFLLRRENNSSGFMRCRESHTTTRTDRKSFKNYGSALCCRGLACSTSSFIVLTSVIFCFFRAFFGFLFVFFFCFLFFFFFIFFVIISSIIFHLNIM